MSKILYIINILRNFSSIDHPLSIAEITNYANKYYDPSGENNFINEVTTRRALTSYLRETPYLNDKQASILSANYRIHILCENPKPASNSDRYTDITKEYSDSEYVHNTNSNKRKKEPKTYYYYEPFIPAEEIANLVNMVESHPFYTSEEVDSITKSLYSISPAYFKYSSYRFPENEKLRSGDSTLQNNLHDLHKYINAKQDIIIEYSYYNEDKELIPHKNYPIQVTPYKLIWSNGYCYLAAYNPFWKDITNYRVDRITYIEPVTDGSRIADRQAPNLTKHTLKYTKAHPVMMSGETTTVSLLCVNNHSMVNRLIDSFGMDIRIQHASPERLHQVFPNHPEYTSDDWLDITCKDVNPDGVALWVKQYCTECVIYAPIDLSIKTKQELQDALQRYTGQA